MNMPRLLIFFILVFICSFTNAQSSQTWIDFAQINELKNNARKKEPDPAKYDPFLNNSLDKRVTNIAALEKSWIKNSNYPILEFEPATNFSDSFRLDGLASIKFIDTRFDNQKVGFSPVGYSLQKKGYTVLGLQITKDPIAWLRQRILQNSYITDTTGRRQLTVVMQKFWFSNSASDRYTVSHPKLVTTLHYQFDIYTSLDIGYYPQTKFAGTLTTLYNEGNAYNTLADSLLVLLTKQVFTNNYAVKETEANWFSPVDFNDYYNKRLKTAAHPEKMPKGVYRTYADFLASAPMSDSVDMIAKYNNFDRALTYACQLTAYMKGEPLSCSRSWGYYDGLSLFVNTGNGFFIKLTRTKADFVFFYLKNIQEERVKPDMQNSMKIGGSYYQVLKDYTKAYALTYQLDYDTGELY